MEFKEIDLNAPIFHYTRHLENTINKLNEHINAKNNEISILNNEISALRAKLDKIKSNPIVKILLKIRRICLNFLGKNK